jgi:hypothetical protein
MFENEQTAWREVYRRARKHRGQRLEVVRRIDDDQIEWTTRDRVRQTPPVRRRG